MRLYGNPVSEGVAIGEAFVYQPFTVQVEETHCTPGEAAGQLAKFEEVRRQAGEEIKAIQQKLEAGDPEKAKIFSAHEDILNDEAMIEEIVAAITNEYCTGDWAIHSVYKTFAAMLQKVPDPLIQERVADLQDVGKRLLRVWYNVPERTLSCLATPAVVVTHDLLPSDTATLDREKVLGILTEIGGPTSHSAIIARSYEIPAVLGIQSLLESVRPGDVLAVDAIGGEVDLNPDEATLGEYKTKQERFEAKRRVTRQFLDVEPLTKDGVRIDIGLNIGSGSKEELVGERYTDFVGLFRTEFLYMGRQSLPGEEEQERIYKKVLKAYGNRPVTLRTLDIGGDKTLDCMELPKEDNPFLGNRALRLCFSKPDLFRVQLRAALKASAFGELWLMLPMVCSLDDVRKARALVDEAAAELKAEGTETGRVKFGIMIEIPSIALISDLVAQEVDFASIGTNDLCQYLMAVDRLNPEVAGYYQSYHPAMFRLIGQVVESFNTACKPVSVCGELGGDPLAAAVLVGLGMRKLSMGLASVAPVKQMLAGLTIAKAERLAVTVKTLGTARQVEEYLKNEVGP